MSHEGGPTDPEQHGGELERTSDDPAGERPTTPFGEENIATVPGTQIPETTGPTSPGLISRKRVIPPGTETGDEYLQNQLNELHALATRATVKSYPPTQQSTETDLEGEVLALRAYLDEAKEALRTLQLQAEELAKPRADMPQLIELQGSVESLMKSIEAFEKESTPLTDEQDHLINNMFGALASIRNLAQGVQQAVNNKLHGVPLDPTIELEQKIQELKLEIDRITVENQKLRGELLASQHLVIAFQNSKIDGTKVQTNPESWRTVAKSIMAAIASSAVIIGSGVYIQKSQSDIAQQVREVIGWSTTPDTSAPTKPTAVPTEAADAAAQPTPSVHPTNEVPSAKPSAVAKPTPPPTTVPAPAPIAEVPQPEETLEEAPSQEMTQEEKNDRFKKNLKKYNITAIPKDFERHPKGNNQHMKAIFLELDFNKDGEKVSQSRWKHMVWQEVKKAKSGKVIGRTDAYLRPENTYWTIVAVEVQNGSYIGNVQTQGVQPHAWTPHESNPFITYYLYRWDIYCDEKEERGIQHKEVSSIGVVDPANPTKKDRATGRITPLFQAVYPISPAQCNNLLPKSLLPDKE